MVGLACLLIVVLLTNEAVVKTKFKINLKIMNNHIDLTYRMHLYGENMI